MPLDLEDLDSALDAYQVHLEELQQDSQWTEVIRTSEDLVRWANRNLMDEDKLLGLDDLAGLVEREQIELYEKYNECIHQKMKLATDHEKKYLDDLLSLHNNNINRLKRSIICKTVKQHCARHSDGCKSDNDNENSK